MGGTTVGGGDGDGRAGQFPEAAVFCQRPVGSSIALLSIAVGVPVYYVWTSAARRRCTAS